MPNVAFERTSRSCDCSTSRIVGHICWHLAHEDTTERTRCQRLPCGAVLQLTLRGRSISCPELADVWAETILETPCYGIHDDLQIIRFADDLDGAGILTSQAVEVLFVRRG